MYKKYMISQYIDTEKTKAEDIFTKLTLGRQFRGQGDQYILYRSSVQFNIIYSKCLVNLGKNLKFMFWPYGINHEVIL